MKPLALLVVMGLAAVVGLAARKYAQADIPSGVVEALPVAPVPEPSKPASEGFKRSEGPVNPVFPESLELRGIARFGHRVSLQMSDGSRITDRDRELIAVERNSAYLCVAHREGREWRGKPCPSCRKYALKPLPVQASERRSVESVARREREAAPLSPVKTYSGAANPGASSYVGEAVIPVNGSVSTEFTPRPSFR